MVYAIVGQRRTNFFLYLPYTKTPIRLSMIEMAEPFELYSHVDQNERGRAHARPVPL